MGATIRSRDSPFERFPNPRRTTAASKNTYTRPGNRQTEFLLSTATSTRAIVSNKAPVSVRPQASARDYWDRQATDLRARPVIRTSPPMA
ncbi:hypothetical protein FOWG_17459 [Fusarium oxysporum f. sp. lycopersici MN25]|nr:hypothetical protein FOWG_17459 [Fusarium oxysporum f. sp. lycopersici MN25]